MEEIGFCYYFVNKKKEGRRIVNFYETTRRFSFTFRLTSNLDSKERHVRRDPLLKFNIQVSPESSGKELFFRCSDDGIEDVKPSLPPI